MVFILMLLHYLLVVALSLFSLRLGVIGARLYFNQPTVWITPFIIQSVYRVV